jgi:hypothetical protein
MVAMMLVSAVPFSALSVTAESAITDPHAGHDHSTPQKAEPMESNPVVVTP